VPPSRCPRFPRRETSERPILDVFRESAYRRLWLSGFCIGVARWMDIVTLGWLALSLTGSPFMVGLAAFARSAPLMIVGPFGGVIADRVPRARILAAAQGTGAVTAVALAVIFATGAGGYGALVALEVVFGAVWAVDFPARRTSLYAILGASRVAQAVSLETVSMQLAKMLGPLAAGACLAHVGAWASFALMAVVYVGGLAASTGLGGRLGAPAVAARSSVAASLRAGLGAAWASRTVRAVLLATVAINVLFFPYQQMLSVFARDVLDAGPAVLGALVAADGAGALVAALAIAAQRGRIAHRTLFAAAIVLGPVLLVALSGSSRLAVCLALLVVLGVAESAFAAMQSTLVLLSAPERTRGGVMGILSACIGTQPFGTLFIGLTTAALGVSLAFALNAFLSLLVIVPLAWILWRGPDG
jgi:MFS family permease